MSDIHFERHLMKNPALPFIFHEDFHKQHSGIANWHDNTEFLYCIEGEGVVNSDSNSIEMKKGDTIVINARCLHTISSGTLVRYHCLIIDNSFFKDNGIKIEEITFDERFYDGDAQRLMLKIAECMKAHDVEYYVAEIRLAVLEYMCHVLKNHSHKSYIKREKISKGYTAVLDTIEYINNHFSEKLTLEDLSSRAGFSRYHFSRIFKENTGVTIIEYINARRCDNAGYLLRETAKTISQISMECGFESPSYFAKAFSSAYGLLPSEYRKRYSRL